MRASSTSVGLGAMPLDSSRTPQASVHALREPPPWGQQQIAQAGCGARGPSEDPPETFTAGRAQRGSSD
eukprot:scaffold231703_cov32-Tisochrysis_lutea.AAC.4